MVKPSLQEGTTIDDFRIEERIHVGGMATLWRVSCHGMTTPRLMKVPKFAEGEDPAAIVSFEMEQMILPRLSGVHIPKFFGGRFCGTALSRHGTHLREHAAQAAPRASVAL
jgi:eukaryotic-like serine/threonine-protein kinase